MIAAVPLAHLEWTGPRPAYLPMGAARGDAALRGSGVYGGPKNAITDARDGRPPARF